ncbi:MAG: hypothetical protein EZS28_010752, partial [Streblomastix strix]
MAMRFPGGCFSEFSFITAPYQASDASVV